jgi:hypothetical protein
MNKIEPLEFICRNIKNSKVLGGKTKIETNHIIESSIGFYINAAFLCTNTSKLLKIKKVQVLCEEQKQQQQQAVKSNSRIKQFVCLFPLS